MNTLHEATKLAAILHAEQFDKGGAPYIAHPMYVMSQMETAEEKVVAVLHDAFEDNPHLNMWNELCHLRNFPRHIVAAIDAITKRPREDLIAYWTRVKANPLALKVKLVDIAHNSSDDRLFVLTRDEQIYLKNKYAKALAFLSDSPIVAAHKALGRDLDKPLTPLQEEAIKAMVATTVTNLCSQTNKNSKSSMRY